MIRRVPLTLEGGEVVGVADIDEHTGKISARVTDPVAAAKLTTLLQPPVNAFSIAAASYGEVD